MRRHDAGRRAAHGRPASDMEGVRSDRHRIDARYVPRDQLPNALRGLRERVANDGTLVVFITKRNWLTRPMIG